MILQVAKRIANIRLTCRACIPGFIFPVQLYYPVKKMSNLFPHKSCKTEVKTLLLIQVYTVLLLCGNM